MSMLDARVAGYDGIAATFTAIQMARDGGVGIGQIVRSIPCQPLVSGDVSMGDLRKAQFATSSCHGGAKSRTTSR